MGKQTGTDTLKKGFAKMVKGGVIMDVTDAKQADIAEKAGAVAVMALERVPSDIRAMGGVARMADPKKIKEIMDTVSIPVMAKVRIGHFTEAQILENMGVDMIDESEVLTPADEQNQVCKKDFKIPFVCGARSLGEAMRRINEGAAMIRTKGEAGTGNVVEAVKHMRLINHEIQMIQKMDENEMMEYSEETKAPLMLVKEIGDAGRLPVVNFAAGGIATPADAALMMQLGADGNFVGSGIFKSNNPKKMAEAIVEATTHYKDPEVLTRVSSGLGDAMKGLDVRTMDEKDLLQTRGV
ncbi:MAG: pyridoxal 5'-phosphate synthase lyase subunit PdxS [Candidatus Altiarchaeota archaeon]|nr:pyridoxal 5'-phosphate synthase lyase subunit PdxS [Candidatus Altiarchaeota archaeon]